MEEFITAIHDKVVSTRNYRKHVLNQDVVDRCRLCGDTNESIKHITDGCRIMSQREYTSNPNMVERREGACVAGGDVELTRRESPDKRRSDRRIRLSGEYKGPERRKAGTESLSDSAPSIGTIHMWFTEFRCGRTSTVDAERSGRPKLVTTPEIVEKIHDMMLNDPKVKLREVANAVGISLERVGNIVHLVLGMKKLCARWVPRLLTVDQKRIPKLHEIGFELIPEPPYSPDLAPSDYYLFLHLKRWLTGKCFHSNEELIAEPEAYFGDLPIEYFSDDIKKLENRWTRCIDVKGEYVEK
ncbi:uncharacterized protein LOC117182982 [Belonocnema kinseyi]|uniref:uncharacterized protein LOC117182982 n=1 Tax=Belonocnema kinseyi TaxID=2817044 RepID=UPI00143DBBF9|nr:uncharacterized protein LOC117182982 [Belonocnema kinseyi]